MSASITPVSSQTLNSSTNVNTLSGNRIVVELGGIAVGLIQEVRASEDFGHEPVGEIGNINVVENVPSRAMYTLNVTAMTLIKSSLRSLGVAPENGAAVLNGVVFNVTVYSKDTGAALRTWLNCSYVSGDLSFSANRIVMQSGVLRALDATGTGV